MSDGAGPDEDWRVPREQAIPRLVDRYGGRLYGLARRLCGSPTEAEDLVQEVFLAAFQAWDGFRGDGDPKGWLFAIAAHACQRMHRRRSGQPAQVESLDVQAPLANAEVGVAGDGLAAALRAEARERVAAAVAALPESYRLPLVLKDFVELPLAAVGEILGIPEATAKTRVHRARLRVREALEEVLPRRLLPPPAYDEQMCLDLLRTKQESLDRGVPMPGADRLICERCRAVFGQLDLAAELCGALGDEELPAPVRALLRERLTAG
ncbi:MAG: RNA polymerase sigma factor [Planctomycetota bacterium]